MTFCRPMWSSSWSVASVAISFFPRVAVCCGNVRLFLSRCCCFFLLCKSENKRLSQHIRWKDVEESLLTQKPTAWGETGSAVSSRRDQSFPPAWRDSSSLPPDEATSNRCKQLPVNPKLKTNTRFFFIHLVCFGGSCSILGTMRWRCFQDLLERRDACLVMLGNSGEEVLKSWPHDLKCGFILKAFLHPVPAKPQIMTDTGLCRFLKEKVPFHSNFLVPFCVRK